jgi:hypothetical protein
MLEGLPWMAGFGSVTPVLDPEKAVSLRALAEGIEPQPLPAGALLAPHGAAGQAGGGGGSSVEPAGTP